MYTDVRIGLTVKLWHLSVCVVLTALRCVCVCVTERGRERECEKESTRKTARDKAGGMDGTKEGGGGRVCHRLQKV